MDNKRTEELMDLYVDEFIKTLVEMFVNNEIDQDEVDTLINRYAISHEGVYLHDDEERLQHEFTEEYIRKVGE